MQKNIVKRYLLEHGIEVGSYYRMLDNEEVLNETQYQKIMLEKLESGEIKINPLQFQMWYKKFRQEKDIFISQLKRMGYLNIEQDVTELTEARSVLSISCVDFHINLEKLEKESGNPFVIDKEFTPVKGCLLANGLYTGQYSIMKNAIENNGSLLVGYCGDVTSTYTGHIINQYKKLRTELLLSGVKDLEETEQTLFGSKKVYVLNYNNKPAFRQVEYVSKTHSER